MDWRQSGTTGTFALIALCALFAWRAANKTLLVSEPLLVTLQPLLTPPDPKKQLSEGLRQFEQKEQKPNEQHRLEPMIMPDSLILCLSEPSRQTMSQGIRY